MNKFAATLAVVAFVSFGAGCAKQEMVKKDENLVDKAPVAAAPAPAKSEPKEEKLPEPKIAESTPADTPAGKAEPATDKDARLQAALQTIYFDFDSAVLSTSATGNLTRNADLLKKEKVKIRIEGNCDERGSDEYNLALGEKRARAALDYLVTLGVPASSISVVSYGKEKPADPTHTEAAWKKNRRDDFVIVR